MSSTLILGQTCLPAIQNLSSTLKWKTLELASTLDKRRHQRYSPWLCIRPVRSRPLECETLLQAPYLPGELLTDKQHLAALSDYLLGEGSSTLNGMPGEPKDWPVFTDIAERGAKTISAFRQGKDLLLSSSPFLSGVYDCIVELVVPLSRDRSSGFSSHYARGAIFRSFPANHGSLSIAMDLAHEMGHQVVMLFQSVDQIITSDPHAPVFSEIRKTNRPAIQSFHAAAALAYMAWLEKDLRARNLVKTFSDERIIDYGGTLQESLKRAISSLSKSCHFTPLGAQLLQEFDGLAGNR